MKRIFWIFLSFCLLTTYPLSSQTQLGPDITGLAAMNELGNSVSLSSDGSRVALGSHLFDGPAGVSSGQVRVYEYDFVSGNWLQVGNAMNGEAAFDLSGLRISLSGDGNRVAIGATGNDGGGQFSGHVRVYQWNGISWNQMGSDLDGEDAFNFFGSSLALSADGNRLAVSAPQNSGNGAQSGHVRVFEWQVSNWVQLGADIDGENAGDRSGESVTLSANGSRVAIGTTQNPDGGGLAGHVRVFQFQSGSWVKLGGDIDGSLGDQVGAAVSFSASGSRLAVGALADDVRIYDFDGFNWAQVGPSIPRVTPGDAFGSALSLSADGQRIAIGGPRDDQGGLAADNIGVVRVYELILGSWDQLGLDISGSDFGDNFGWAVSLSADGQRVAAGAPFADISFSSAGLVRVYDNVNIVLPLKVLDFRAAVQKTSILLRAEVASDNFSEVVRFQHSPDARNWHTLVTAPVQELLDPDASQLLWQHKQPSPGLNFYRLQEMYGEQAIDLSPVQSVYWEPRPLVGVYPNPTRDYLLLEETWEGRLELWDARGNLLARYPQNTQKVDLSRLPTGFYFLVMTGQTSKRTVKIIKE